MPSPVGLLLHKRADADWLREPQESTRQFEGKSKGQRRFAAQQGSTGMTCRHAGAVTGTGTVAFTKF
eukprot:2370899-Rhodomonas_salina.1